MSGNPFEQWSDKDVIDLVDAFPLAWVVSGGPEFSASVLPILLETGADGRPASLLGHIAKSNPQFDRIRAEPRTLFLFTGPHGYISPELVTTTRDWGPTWNYATARIVADVEFDENLNDEALERLVSRMEQGRRDPWTRAHLGERYDRMKRAIIGFRAPIVGIEGRFKLGQDERGEVLSDIVSGLGPGDLGDWMRRFNADPLMPAEAIGSAYLKAAAAAGALFASPALAEASDRKLQVGAIYTSDSFGNLRGGWKTGFSQMGMLELMADAEGRVFGLEGVSAHANVQYVHGRSLNGKLIGDAQVTSNIDAPNGIRLFEMWVSVPVTPDGFVKAGLIDLNGEFDVQEVGSLFLNSSHGIGPDFSQSGRNGPSIFPTTSSAVVAGVTKGRVSFRAGLFDAVSGDPDRPRRTVFRLPGDTGLLLVGETEIRLTEHSRLQVGAWGYTTRFETIADPDATRRGNRGAYALVEGRLGSMASEPVDGWMRIGTAETSINPIGFYLGGGVAFGPEDRRFGVALAHARLGKPARRLATEQAETVVELTYAHAVGDRLTVQPDVQFVIDPGFDRSVGNSLSAGVRLQLTLF